MASVAQLMDMGFSQAQAAKAIAATGNTSTEAAMEWYAAPAHLI
jgi:uncharacterized UBP type Zn finger protein